MSWDLGRKIYTKYLMSQILPNLLTHPKTSSRNTLLPYPKHQVILEDFRMCVSSCKEMRVHCYLIANRYEFGVGPSLTLSKQLRNFDILPYTIPIFRSRNSFLFIIDHEKLKLPIEQTPSCFNRCSIYTTYQLSKTWQKISVIFLSIYALYMWKKSATMFHNRAEMMNKSLVGIILVVVKTNLKWVIVWECYS